MEPTGRLTAGELALARRLRAAMPTFAKSPTATVVVLPDGRLLLANDAAALSILSAAGGSRFVAGPYLNVYNGETLKLLHELGAYRWVLPVEQSRDMLAALQTRRPIKMQTEVQVFGRLPLALSARCFTARAHHLPKDECEFRCRDYPDGLALSTREGKRWLSQAPAIGYWIERKTPIVHAAANATPKVGARLKVMSSRVCPVVLAKSG